MSFRNEIEKTRLLIIWFSRTGTSKALAEAAYSSAAEQDAAVEILNAVDAQPSDMLAAQGYLFVCPENLAAIAGGMKEFLDRSYYPLLGQIEGRPYAAMIAAGSDGENAKKQLERIATGWRLKRIADTHICCTDAQSADAILAPKTPDESNLKNARDLGATFAAGLAMGIF